MDKSKLPIPRWAFGVTPKELDHFVRPVVTLTASIAHGWATNFYLADETESHGQDAFIEVLTRTIDTVFELPGTIRKRMPDH